MSYRAEPGDTLAQQSLDALTAIARASSETATERGDVTCPRCGDRLDYSCGRHGRRLVIRGKCRTAGCIEVLT